MKAAVWNGAPWLDLMEVPLPQPKHGEVLVKVEAVGICTTDIHVMKKLITLGNYPVILGHEISGTISALGENVTNWKSGERVVLDTTIGCMKCEYCKEGMYHLCNHGGEIGTNPHDGGYAEYVCAPEYLLHRLPDEITFDEAGIMESFICPAGSIYRLGMRFGETVLIQGAGPAGLAYIQVVKSCGAGKIIVSARQDERLALAAQFGADIIINEKKDNVVNRVLKETNGKGVELSIEAAGVKSTVETAIRLAAKNGRVILYGIPPVDQCPPIPVQDITGKQLSIMGAIGNPQVWEPVIKMTAKGCFDLKSMVTHKFPLNDINTAIEYADKRIDGAIKVVVNP